MTLFTPLIRAPAVAEAPVVVAPAAMAAVAEAAAAAEDNSIRIINRLKSKKIGLTHAKASP